MNKISYIKLTLLLVLSGLMGSCEDYLSPEVESQKSPEQIFSDAGFTNSEIIGIYNAMTENRSYRNRLIGYMGVNTDIETQSGSKSASVSTNDRKTLAVYLASSELADGFNDKDGGDPWSRVYACIDRANQAINYIPTYSSIDPNINPQMACYYGEALTLRAFFYFDLIKFWGDVPARFDLMNSNNLYVSKSDRDVVYNKILSDLSVAEELVPWADKIPAGTNTTQRVSKGFIKALKARIALQYSGYSLRKKSATDYHIVRTIPDAKRDSLYQVAKKACEDVIVMEGTSSGYKLMNTFEDFFRNQCQDDVSSGKEAIFQMPFSSTRGEYMSYLGLRHEFEAKKYDQWVGNENTPMTIKNEVSVVPSFFYDFASSDTRRDVTIAPFKWKDGVQVMTSVNVFNLAKWRPEWGKRVFTSNDDGINFCVIRYADVLLMYAEVLNELEGPANAIKYLEQVRNRAFNGNSRMDLIASKYPNYVSDKEQFFNALIDERAYEFCGENIRKWDLMRWGILKERMDQAKLNLNQLRNSGIGQGDMGTYATVPNTVYWKWNADAQTIAIYGLNRTDTDISDKTTANGWSKKSWTNATDSGTGKYLLDKDTYVEKTIYQANPDENQLLPIMSVVITNSQGSLTNDPLTNWTPYAEKIKQ